MLKQQKEYDPGTDEIPSVPQVQMSAWQDFMSYLAYLSYLKAIQTPPKTEGTVSRTLIIVVALALTIIVLVTAGVPGVISDLLKLWSIFL